MQLSKEAPEQAQEFDRLRSEEELRRGVIAPLTGLICAVFIPIWWPLALLALPVGLTLLSQANDLRLKSNELLARCLYQGYTKLPALENLIEALGRMQLSGMSWGTWSGATLVALQQLGETEYAEQASWEFLESDPEPEDVHHFLKYIDDHAPGEHDYIHRRANDYLERIAARDS